VRGSKLARGSPRRQRSGAPGAGDDDADVATWTEDSATGGRGGGQRRLRPGLRTARPRLGTALPAAGEEDGADGGRGGGRKTKGIDLLGLLTPGVFLIFSTPGETCRFFSQFCHSFRVLSITFQRSPFLFSFFLLWEDSKQNVLSEYLI
jgi:hypothetical protein